MPKYVIEREVQGVDKLKGRDRQAAALQSIRALNEIGTEIQWIHSYISENRTHCVYLAENEKLIHDHAKKSKFPVTNIYKVEYILEPVSGEG
ncbi:MAG: DUF4242 domain-containing protein [Balneolaceae bacterium]|nr:DUF4242 domain-containing protein [Balneolaceae bacterium]